LGRRSISRPKLAASVINNFVCISDPKKKRAEQQKIKEKNTPGQSKEKIRTGPSKKEKKVK